MEKEKRVAELVIGNTELAISNKQKEELATELFEANKYLEEANSNLKNI